MFKLKLDTVAKYCHQSRVLLFDFSLSVKLDHNDDDDYIDGFFQEAFPNRKFIKA